MPESLFVNYAVTKGYMDFWQVAVSHQLIKEGRKLLLSTHHTYQAVADPEFYSWGWQFHRGAPTYNLTMCKMCPCAAPSPLPDRNMSPLGSIFNVHAFSEKIQIIGCAPTPSGE